MYFFLTDIEAQIREIQGQKAALEEAQGVGLDSTGYYDQEIYGGSDSRFAGYVTSIAATELEDVSAFRKWKLLYAMRMVPLTNTHVLAWKWLNLTSPFLSKVEIGISLIATNMNR